jgi:hypothetical protein
MSFPNGKLPDISYQFKNKYPDQEIIALVRGKLSKLSRSGRYKIVSHSVVSLRCHNLAGLQLGAVCLWECHECQNLVLGTVHQGGEFGDFGAGSQARIKELWSSANKIFHFWLLGLKYSRPNALTGLMFPVFLIRWL